MMLKTLSKLGINSPGFFACRYRKKSLEFINIQHLEKQQVDVVILKILLPSIILTAPG